MLASEEMTSGSGIQQATDVVVIDDEESMCEACRQTLEAQGFSAAVARDGSQGLELIREMTPNVVLLDLKMPGITGTEVLIQIPEIDDSIVTIIITGYGTIDSAVESMKAGAFDFLTKPFEPERLIERVRSGMELSQSRKKVQLKQIAPERVQPPAEIPVEKTRLNRQNILLKGLEALGEYYSLGVQEHNFFEELRYLEAEAKYHVESLGQIKKTEKAVRDMVQDLRVVDDIIAKHGYQKSALLQILLDIQGNMNWLPRHVLKWVSARLNVPLARIYTIANFYEAFSLEPRGAHMIQGCTGTACHVRGASHLLANVTSILGIQPGQTDSKGLFTLKTVHCMGCCALAPVIKIDNDYFSNPTIRDLKKLFNTEEEQEQRL